MKTRISSKKIPIAAYIMSRPSGLKLPCINTNHLMKLTYTNDEKGYLKTIYCHIISSHNNICLFRERLSFHLTNLPMKTC